MWSLAQTGINSSSSSTTTTTSYLNPVTSGNLLVIVGAVNNQTSITVADGVNHWTPMPEVKAGGGSNNVVSYFTIAASSLPTNVTLTTAGSTSKTDLVVAEFSVSPYAKIIIPSPIISSVGTGLNFTSALSPNPGFNALMLGIATIGSEAYIVSPGSGYTAIRSFGQNEVSMLFEYILNSQAASGLATGSVNISQSWSMINPIFSEVYPITNTLMPILPTNHSNTVTIPIVGSGTNWGGSTNFFGSGTPGASVVGQAINSTTSANVYVTTGSSTGLFILSDGANQNYGIPINTPNFVISSSGFVPNSTYALSVTGLYTLWGTEPTSPPLFTSSNAETVSSISVVGNTYASFNLHTNTSYTGPAFITDTSTQQIIQYYIYPQTPGISTLSTSIPTNKGVFNLPLIGYGTSWKNGTTFTMSGVPTTYINGTPTINSFVSATLPIFVGANTGILTIYDGTYNFNINLINSAMEIAPYVSKSSKLLMFNPYASILLDPATLNPTYSIVDTSVANGGFGYTNPVANIAGGLSIQLIDGGKGFTTAPNVYLISGSGNGTGASVNAVVTNGYVSSLIVVPGQNYIYPPKVVFEGGGGNYAKAIAHIITNNGIDCILGKPVVKNGIIQYVPVAVNGSGYQSAPPIIITDPTGSGAIVNAVLGGLPTQPLVVSANPTVYVNNRQVQVPLYITNIPISNCGSGYGPSSPSVIPSGGNGAGGLFFANIAPTGGVALTLGNPGSGYLFAPGVVISKPNAGTTSASATSFINSLGQVIGFSTIPGTGYLILPTVTISGGGGNGATASPSILGGVISSISTTSPAYNYLVNDNITVNIAPPSVGATATGIAVLNPLFSTNSTAVPYQLLCGSVQNVLVQNGGQNYINPTFVITGGGGTGFQLSSPIIASGVIVAVSISGTSTTETNIFGLRDNLGTGSGFVGTYLINSPTTTITGVIVERGGQNYSSNLTYLQTGFDGSQGTVVFKGVTLASGVIQAIPILNHGSGYTSMPIITISDVNGSGAIITPIMSGPLPTDVITYSTPNNWLYTNAGPISNSSGNAYNFSGQLEPLYSGIIPTLEMGMNMTFPFGNNVNHFIVNNCLKYMGNMTGATAPTVTFLDVSGTLASAIGNVDSNGTVVGYQILCGGSNNINPTGLVAAAPAGGTTATINSLTVVSGVITSIIGNNPGSGYGGSTLDGRPISINSSTDKSGNSYSGFPCCYASFSTFTVNAGTDGVAISNEYGPWVFSVTENNPSNPLNVLVYSFNKSAYITGIITHGQVINGSEVGKTWLFNVPSGYTSLYINIYGPQAGTSAAYTFTNEYMSPPSSSGTANYPNISDPLECSRNEVGMYSFANSGAISSVRVWPFANYQWSNDIVYPSDLRPANDFTWNDGAQRTYNVVVKQVRQWQTFPSGNITWYSPYVFVSENYPGAFSSANIPNAPAPYYYSPPTGLLLWTTDSFGDPYVAAEFITQSPHGMNTGHVISIPRVVSGTTNLVLHDYNSNSYLTSASLPTAATVWVTGPNSFAISQVGGSNARGTTPANVSGVYNTNFSMTVTYPANANAPCYEAVGKVVENIQGCSLHTLVPFWATDTCLSGIAVRIRDNIPVGRKVWPEFANEHWNTTFANYWCFNSYALSNLCNGSASIAATSNNFYSWRQARVHQIFEDVFNQTDINGNTNRGNSIVCGYGGQGGNVAWIDAVISYVNTYNSTNPARPFEMNSFQVGSYQNVPSDTAFINMAASTYSNFPGSIQYCNPVPFTMEAYLDYAKNAIAYIHQKTMAFSSNFLTTYNTLPGQPYPYAINYELAINAICPTPISTIDANLRAYLTHDMVYNSYMYDVETAAYIGIQRAGYRLSNIFNSNQTRQNGTPTTIIAGNAKNDADGTVIWGHTVFENQTWGRGDGTLDGNGNPTVNTTFISTGISQDQNNASVMMQAFRDWAAAEVFVVNIVVPVVPTVQQSGYLNYYIYANQNKTYVVNNGGTAIGLDQSSISTQRIITGDWGYIILGQGQGLFENKPMVNTDQLVQAEHSTVNTMTPGKYIIMSYSNEICGNPNTILVSPGQSYQRQSQPISTGYVNTWKKVTTGGWYYQTGKPVNAQYSRDHVGTDLAKSPGRLSYNQGFLPYIRNYHSKTD